jgi:hypothetical protein
MAVAADKKLATRDLDRGDGWAAARLLTDAFMDDPIWLATGPANRTHRRAVLMTLYLAEVLIGRWRKGIVLGAYSGGRLDGVIIVFPQGGLFPWWTWALRSVACVIAGPLALVRSLKVVGGLDALHPSEPHAHFWLVASRPGALGAGYSVMRAATARTDALGRPGYLEATSQEMAEMKELLGWQPRERHILPSGKPVTTMWRAVAARAR